MGALLGVISEIQRVHTNPEDHMDVRNYHQQGTYFKLFVLQIFWFEFVEWFYSILQKSHL